MRAEEFIKKPPKRPAKIALDQNTIAETALDQNTIAETAAILQRDCQPFLSAIDNNIHKFSLYRGIKDGFRKLEFLSGPHLIPKNRRPVDTDVESHKIIDDWFEKQTGIRYRSNAMFCTGSLSQASEYGDVFLAFPIGHFNFCWSTNYADLYSSLDHIDMTDTGADGEEYYDADKEVRQVLHRGNYHNNVGPADFQQAVLSGHETMINCENYYLVKGAAVEVLSKLQDALRK